MGYCRLGLAAVVTFFLIAFSSVPARAGAASGPAYLKGAAVTSRPLTAVHFRRVQSFYCYPRVLWWFYRPYTTGQDGHPRCMPYFHYLEPTGRDRAPRDRSIK